MPTANFEYKTPDDFEKLECLRELPGVYVNPKRLPTTWGNIAHIHIENFKYLSSVARFDKFVLHASNDAFVRPGCEGLINDHVASYPGFPVDLEIQAMWSMAGMAVRDRDLRRMLDSLGGAEVRGGQVEALFYDVDLFREIAEIITRFCAFEPGMAVYTREEFYFHSVAWRVIDGAGLSHRVLQEPYLLCDVCKDFSIDVPLIDRIRAGKQIFPTPLLAVKRVQRVLDDPVRQYIRQIRYEEEEAARMATAPFELEHPYKRVFFHQPDTLRSEWVDVVVAYAKALSGQDDACLILPLADLAQDQVSETITQSLAMAGIDPETAADIVVVPDVHGLSQLGQMFAAADVVVPGSDPVQAARARRCGRPVLRDTSLAGWRGALA